MALTIADNQSEKQSPANSGIFARVGRHLAVIILFGIIALYIGNPLATHFRTRLYSAFGYGPRYSLREASPFIWYDWWLDYALLQRHESPFTTDRIFAPVGINLSTQDLSPFSALTALPVTIADGPIAGLNFAFFVGTVLSGYGMYLLARYLLRQEMAAVLAGLFLAFAPSRLAELYVDHPNVANQEWIPIFILAFLKTIRREGRASPWLAGITLFFVALSGYELFIATDLVALIIVAYHYRAVRDNLKDALRGLVVTGAVFSVLFAPILIAAIPTLRGSPIPQPSILNAAEYSLRPQMFFTPIWNNADFSGFAMYRVNPAFLGWVVAPLAIVSLLRGRLADRKLWLACIIIFAILTLGPLLKLSPSGPIIGRIHGIRVAIPLPFLVFRAFPLMNEFRTPLRFVCIVFLGLAILAADGYSQVASLVVSRLRTPSGGLYLRAALLAVFGVAFLAEANALTPPTYRVPNPPLYRQIAAAPGDPVVVNLPLGWNTATRQLGEYPGLGEQAQYFETIDEKRTLSGMMMRVPTTTLTYFTNFPLIQYLLDPRTQQPSSLNLNQQSVTRQLRELQVGYIAIEWHQYTPTELRNVEAFIRDTMPVTLVARDQETILYRVKQTQ